jgi:hypothetical protein
LAEFFGENILKIITSVPGVNIRIIILTHPVFGAPQRQHQVLVDPGFPCCLVQILLVQAPDKVVQVLEVQDVDGIDVADEVKLFLSK